MGVMILILNVSTFIRVSKHSRQMHGQMKEINSDLARAALQKEKQAGKLLAIISVLFFVVYLPGIVLRNIDPDARFTKPIAQMVCYVFDMSIGIIDPLIYIIFQQKYRNEIKKTFKSFFDCIKNCNLFRL